VSSEERSSKLGSQGVRQRKRDRLKVGASILFIEAMGGFRSHGFDVVREAEDGTFSKGKR